MAPPAGKQNGAGSQTRNRLRQCVLMNVFSCMWELLTAAVRVGGVTHLVGPVTMVLQGGPRSVVSGSSYHPDQSGGEAFVPEMILEAES